MDDNLILELKDLRIYFQLDEGLLKAVDGINLKLRKGVTLGLVGESGCGKSVATQSLLRLNPGHAKLHGEILIYEKDGKRLEEPLNLIPLPTNGNTIREIRGGEISMIFQEPMKAFSPIHTIGNQIMEGILIHNDVDKEKAREITIEMLRKVGMSNPEQRIDEYPHQLSGGMRQRAMIAMAISCNPTILIADEPTTALDVTVQAQVLQLINDLKSNNDSTVIFITHDMGVIAEMATEVAVMYMGKIVEYADVETMFHDPRHPYTVALLRSIPSVVREAKSKLASIEGTVPYPMGLKPSCGFYSRCPDRVDGKCNTHYIDAVEVAPGHMVRCVFAEPYAPKQ